MFRGENATPPPVCNEQRREMEIERGGMDGGMKSTGSGMKGMNAAKLGPAVGLSNVTNLLYVAIW